MHSVGAAVVTIHVAERRSARVISSRYDRHGTGASIAFAPTLIMSLTLGGFMRTRIGQCFGVTLMLPIIAAAGCGHETSQDVAIVAPGFEPSRVRFASYDYSPVGEFALQRGDRMPFVDTNGDGQFDTQREASGRCDRRTHTCWIEHAKLRLITTGSECAGTVGTWILGNTYSRDGEPLETSLCDDRGTCAEQHRDAFRGVDSINAIWVPSEPESQRARTVVLRAGHEEQRYDQIVMPAMLQLGDVEVDHQAGLRVSVSADQTIDMAYIRVMRGSVLQWSSAGHTGVFEARGTRLQATLPQATIDLCGAECEVFLQVAHVWRDDQVFAISEMKHKVF